MERLTTRIYGTVGIAREHEEMHTMDEWMDMIQTRLCEYEDTGLTPAEIIQLKNERPTLEWARGQLDRIVKAFGLYHDGQADAINDMLAMLLARRLIPVPCASDEIYEIDPEHGVVKHTVTDVHWMVNTVALDDNGMTWADYYTDEEIGNAYPSREAAEFALAAAASMEG